MRYDPATANADLWDDGWYDAAVVSAEEKKSKKQNPMLVVTADIWGDNGKITIDTYFVANVKASMSRLKKLCAAVGIDYDAGEVTPEMLNGKNFRAYLKTQKGTGGYEDKNVISSFAEEGFVPNDQSNGLDDDAKADSVEPKDDIPF